MSPTAQLRALLCIAFLGSYAFANAAAPVVHQECANASDVAGVPWAHFRDPSLLDLMPLSQS